MFHIILKHHSQESEVEFIHSVIVSLPPPWRICNRRCLTVCLLATLRKNFRTDLHEIFNWDWTNNYILVAVWIHITTLVRRGMVEVCTVPVLLVYYVMHKDVGTEAIACARSSDMIRYDAVLSRWRHVVMVTLCCQVLVLDWLGSGSKDRASRFGW